MEIRMINKKNLGITFLVMPFLEMSTLLFIFHSWGLTIIDNCCRTCVIVSIFWDSHINALSLLSSFLDCYLVEPYVLSFNLLAMVNYKPIDQLMVDCHIIKTCLKILIYLCYWHTRYVSYHTCHLAIGQC